MSTPLRLSVLDQSPVPEGSSPAQALEHSIDLARHADRLGYTRFWMSEHHAMQTLACTAPEILLARIGAETNRIRLGSGGIMLPHYSPLKVAEVFRTLYALYPDRIDLGIGRAPGGGPVESLALRRERRVQPVDDFPDQLSEVLAFLGRSSFMEGHPFAKLRAEPHADGAPRVWLLGSSLWSASAAAQFGLPYAFAHFFSPVATRQAIETYQATFVRNDEMKVPEATVAVGVICADTEAEARRLHASVRLLQQRIRLGDRRPVAEPEAATRELAQSHALSGFQGEEGEWPRYVVGTPEVVRRDLLGMASALGVGELIVNTITWDHQARLRSYELLAQAFDLDGLQMPDSPSRSPVAVTAAQ